MFFTFRLSGLLILLVVGLLVFPGIGAGLRHRSPTVGRSGIPAGRNGRLLIPIGVVGARRRSLIFLRAAAGLTAALLSLGHPLDSLRFPIAGHHVQRPDTGGSEDERPHDNRHNESGIVTPTSAGRQVRHVVDLPGPRRLCRRSRALGAAARFFVLGAHGSVGRRQGLNVDQPRPFGGRSRARRFRFIGLLVDGVHLLDAVQTEEHGVFIALVDHVVVERGTRSAIRRRLFGRGTVVVKTLEGSAGTGPDTRHLRGPGFRTARCGFIGIRDPGEHAIVLGGGITDLLHRFLGFEDLRIRFLDAGCVVLAGGHLFGGLVPVGILDGIRRIRLVGRKGSGLRRIHHTRLFVPGFGGRICSRFFIPGTAATHEVAQRIDVSKRLPVVQTASPDIRLPVEHAFTHIRGDLVGGNRPGAVAVDHGIPFDRGVSSIVFTEAARSSATGFGGPVSFDTDHFFASFAAKLERLPLHLVIRDAVFGAAILTYDLHRRLPDHQELDTQTIEAHLPRSTPGPSTESSS